MPSYVPHHSSCLEPTCPPAHPHTPTRPAGDLSDLLKMELGNGQWLAFKDFDSGSALDSALALVEHLMEGH